MTFIFNHYYLVIIIIFYDMSEIEKPKFEDFWRIGKLNTIEFNTWNNSEKSFEEIFPNWVVTWEYLDENMIEFFCEENLKTAFWEKYKQYNEIETTDLRWNKFVIKMPSIVWWWMWIDISSFSLVSVLNEAWFSGHTSSIWVGFHNYQSKYPQLFKKGYVWRKELDEIVEKDFYKKFWEELWFDEEFIDKHFFKCNDIKENEVWKWFNIRNWKWKILRMMDLVTIFEKWSEAKKRWEIIGQNLMLKTSSYLAALKVSILAWYDYLSTSAWIPSVNPKVFLQDFFQDLKDAGYNIRIPAFWLVTATTMGLDTDYDYYVYEEWKQAWWHTVDWKWLERFKKDFDKKFVNLPNTPLLYAAWSVSTNEELKKIFDIWYNWSQNATVFIPTDEAINGEWEWFKKAIIAWNHFWEDTELDRKYYEWVEKTKEKFERFIKLYNRKLIKYLNEKWGILDEETPEIAIVRDYLYKIIYNDFFDNEVKSFEDLNDKEKEYYNLLKDFISDKFGWDIEKINMVLRRYWNAKKFVKEFDKFQEKNLTLPTHVRFDSTVWYKASARVKESMVRIILSIGEIKQCVECLTWCLLWKRWNVNSEDASKFCIKDELNPVLEEEHNPDWEWIVFSWRSRCFYPEIRPTRDILAGMMGYYVER